MTNEALVTPASIEHLDHDEACEVCGKRADFWADSHGCAEALGCTACLTKDKAQFEKLVERWGRALCGGCFKPFTVYEELTRWVPLR